MWLLVIWRLLLWLFLLVSPFYHFKILLHYFFLLFFIKSFAIFTRKILSRSFFLTKFDAQHLCFPVWKHIIYRIPLDDCLCKYSCSPKTYFLMICCKKYLNLKKFGWKNLSLFEKDITKWWAYWFSYFKNLVTFFYA